MVVFYTHIFYTSHILGTYATHYLTFSAVFSFLSGKSHFSEWVGVSVHALTTRAQRTRAELKCMRIRAITQT